GKCGKTFALCAHYVEVALAVLHLIEGTVPPVRLGEGNEMSVAFTYVQNSCGDFDGRRIFNLYFAQGGRHAYRTFDKCKGDEIALLLVHVQLRNVTLFRLFYGCF